MESTIIVWSNSLLPGHRIRLLFVYTTLCVGIVILCFQSMTLKEASVTALSILKQVMEEKLNSTNVEVRYYVHTQPNVIYTLLEWYGKPKNYRNLHFLLFIAAHFFRRIHFIGRLVLESLKFKKLLELHVFYKKPLYKQPGTRQPKI